MDCYNACTQHVSLTVSKVDWQHWAMALAGNCQREVEEKKDNKYK